MADRKKTFEVTSLISVQEHPSISPLVHRKAALIARQEALAAALPEARQHVETIEQREGMALAAGDDKDWTPSSDLVEAQTQVQAIEMQTRVVQHGIAAVERDLAQTTEAVREEIKAALRQGALGPLDTVLHALDELKQAYAALHAHWGHCQRLLGGEGNYILPGDLFDPTIDQRQARLQQLKQQLERWG